VTDELPDEARAEWAYTEAVGLKSHFTVPLKAGGEVVGALGVDHFSAHSSWSQELISRIELLASVYANALYRRRVVERLQKAHNLNRSVLASVSSEIVVLDGEGRVVVVNEAWERSARREGVALDLLSPGSDYIAMVELAIREGQVEARESLEGLRAVLSGKEPSFQATYRYNSPSSAHRHYLLTISRRKGGDGVVLVHTDVTELEEAKARLEESLQEIRELKERIEAENVVLHQQVRHTQGFDEVIGTSAALERVLAKVEQVASTETPVLLLGETGTGKELLARAIHERSRRSERPLVTINCAALPATLVESEVFGYEKGAFTGAHQRSIGRFEVAHGGTLLLDEIGELPLEVQAKLLRVLETGELERLGSPKTIHVDVRLITATNRDLAREVREGRFRSDLYYRLNVFPLSLPPLRKRPEDIPVLVWHFITRKQGNLGKKVKRVPERLMSAFAAYSWPGNVRELENVVERSLIMTNGGTLATDPLFLQGAPEKPASSGTTLAEMERAHIRSVLEECGWKLSGKGNAAERLGLKRSTLQYRMSKLGIHRPAHGS
jgi:transcriptional regulator with GAF, ATPase, and Fis domain